MSVNDNSVTEPNEEQVQEIEDNASDSDNTSEETTENTTEITTDDETEPVQKMGMSEMTPPLFVVCFVICIFATSIISYYFGYQKSLQDAQLAQVQDIHDSKEPEEPEIEVDVDDDFAEGENEQTLPQADMIYSMQQLYDLNEDTIGWLTIDDTNIDYPVMQSMEDEEFYLNRDFQKNYSAKGCLIMDTDSVVGSGTSDNDYADGTKPGTNLIIHGHNMKNGDMFGNLDKYRNVNYYKDHRIIRFSSLYEEREYEIISVFLSQVYLKTQTDVFKYYKFFQADTEEEFNDFYDNIMKLSLYDTGVKAKFGDEFISLSVCAYHVENGRLVVVGKRIK